MFRSARAATLNDIGHFFDRIYVINLVDRTDRLREITIELQKIGLDFNHPNVRLFSTERCTEGHGFPSAAVRGCFLSHLSVLMQAHTDRLRNVLIMEDDLSIYAAFRDYAEVLLHEAETYPWDLIYFGHREELPATNHPHLSIYTRPIETAHFYAVNQKTLGDLIDYLKAVQLRPLGDPAGGPMHYDGALTMFRLARPEVCTLISRPSLGGQRSSRSDIHSHWFDKVWGLRNAADVARSVKRR